MRPRKEDELKKRLLNALIDGKLEKPLETVEAFLKLQNDTNGKPASPVFQKQLNDLSEKVDGLKNSIMLHKAFGGR